MALFRVKAVFDYASEEEDDLQFSTGQIIAVTADDEEDWYTGEYTDDNGSKLSGIFPRNFVERYEPKTPPRPVRAARPKSEAVNEIAPAPVAAVAQPPPPPMSQAVLGDPIDPEIAEPAPVEAETPVQSPPTQPIAPSIPKAEVAEISKPVPSVREPPTPTAAEDEPVAKTVPAKSPKPTGNAFKDRIAAFNKSAPPVAPMKPSGFGAPTTSSFVKKAYVAPPPSRNAYVPMPEKQPPPKVYRREEDPSITSPEQTEQISSPPDVSASSAPVTEEDQPKPTSLKERIALLQKQQLEQANRAAAAASAPREKPKAPAQAAAPPPIPSGDAVDDDLEDEPSARSGPPPPVPRAALSPGEEDLEEVRSLSVDEPTPLDRVVSATQPSLHNEEEVAGSEEQAQPEPGAEASEEQGEEQPEMDPETKRRLELRERMAKMSGGMGMAGMFGPPGGMPMMSRKKQEPAQTIQPSADIGETKSEESSRRLPPVPIMPMPGMALPGMSAPRGAPPVPKTPEVEREDDLEEPRDPVEVMRSEPAEKDIEDVGQESDSFEASPSLPTSRPPPPVIPSQQEPPPPARPSAPPVPVSNANRAPPPAPPAVNDRSDPIPPARTNSTRAPPPIPQATRPLSTQKVEPMEVEPPSSALPRQPPPAPPTAPQAKTDREVQTTPSLNAASLNPSSRPPPPPPPPITEDDDDEEFQDEEADDDVDEDDVENPEDEDDDDEHEQTRNLEPSLRSSQPSGAPPSIPPIPSRMSISPPPPPIPSHAVPAQTTMRSPPPPPPAHQAPVQRQPSGAARVPPPPPPVPVNQNSSQPLEPARTGSYAAPPPSLPARMDSGITSPPSHPSRQLTEESYRASGDMLQRPSDPSLYGAIPPNPGRKSLDVRNARQSMDGNRPTYDSGFMASNIDLGQSSKWWLARDAAPPALQNRSDILLKVESGGAPESSGSRSMETLASAIFADYSMTIVVVHFNPRDPSDAELSQEHHAPPQKLRQDQLESYHSKYGSSIADKANSKVNTVVGNGTAQAFVHSLFAELNGALPPVGTRSFGAMIYTNLANATNQQFDEIRAGDIVTFRNAKLVGTHGALKSKYSHEVGKPDHVGVVVDWDGTKKKLRCWEQGRENKKVKVESFKLDDLRSGEVKIWRVVGKEWIGW